MPIVKTHELVQSVAHPDQMQVYNGLDCCLTLEVFHEIQRLHPSHFRTGALIYNFERALQAPALDMMLRGWKIDEYERRKAVAELRKDIARLCDILDRYVTVVRGKPLSPRPARQAHIAVRFSFPNSQKQLREFFYTDMKLPEQWKYSRGEKKLSMDRETLEKLQAYWHAQPIIGVILAIRELDDMRGVLESEIDLDGRIRQSYNIAGTETGRPSSSKSSFGTGTNLMNIKPDLRRVCISDTGWKLAAIDFEQSEARDLGWWCWLLFNDGGYLDACESGDLHTTTARLIWPRLAWSNDDIYNKTLAEQLFYRHFTYRDMSKRGGHGSNYLGSPITMARHLKVPQKLMEDFQLAYFHAFPALPRLHQWVAQEIQTKQKLTTFFGRERHFFSRPNDDSTLREAVAHMGQSPTADRTSLAMWRIWKHMPQVQLLHEVYDCVYFQYREAEEASVLAQAMKLIEVPFIHNGRKFIVPGEAKVGWNWGAYHVHGKECKPNCAITINPNGLKKWKGQDERQRLVGLERVL